MAGLKVMTATSGPGISLCSENISFAIGGEIPIVIVDVQRLGPSTGSPTRGADGDIQFLRWGSSGGLPVIVLAPVDVTDCYLLTVHAFNLAEEFRCPVFIASNKEIGTTRDTVDLESLDVPPITCRAAPPPGSPFVPFAPGPGMTVPYFLPIGGQELVRQTSSTHGQDGYVTTDPGEISSRISRLADKFRDAADRITFYDASIEDGADTLLIAYGVTARAALDVHRRLKNAGRPISLLVIKTLWPVPERLLAEIGSRHERVVVVEMNTGQYVHEIARALPGRAPRFLGQMDGRLITPSQIEQAVLDA